jgi:alpha/beta superfamily hydrolase
VRIKSTDGLSLEAEFDSADAATGAAVICHAHPRMQGTMNSPLLLAARDALVHKGWSVLRFNFRGVGDSEGEFEEGIGEVFDALGGIHAVKERMPGRPLAILGWSFGGAVALRAAAEADEVAACALIAPAIEAAGLPPARELGVTAPILIVCGDNDESVSPESCRRWAEASGARYEEIKAANHFFWAKYDAVTKVITTWLEEILA